MALIDRELAKIQNDHSDNPISHRSGRAMERTSLTGEKSHALSRTRTLKQGPTRMSERLPSFVVVSGGTAANDFVPAFGTRCAFVLPVSDDGGSSSEILRCLGGPSIGDIRSRLIRLIPLDQPDLNSAESSSKALTRQSIYNLFAHRLPTVCRESEAKDMWLDVVEGKSALWNGIPEDRRECIRAFFVHFNLLVLKRAHKRFSFRNFSLGNGFLSAARDMLGGLPGAIFIFKAITESQDTGDVLPVILTNRKWKEVKPYHTGNVADPSEACTLTERITIAAELISGAVITGQCEISHPSTPLPVQQPSASSWSRPGSRNSVHGDTSLSDSASSDDSGDGRSTLARNLAVGQASASQAMITPRVRHVEPDVDPNTIMLSTSASSTVSTLSTGPIPVLLQAPGSPWRETDGRSGSTLATPGIRHDRPDLKRVASGVDVNARMGGVGTIWTGEAGMASLGISDSNAINLDEAVGSNSLYVKGQQEIPLESRIERLFYINVYGQEIYPEPNAQVMNHLASKEILVYSCGSLWTSIVPCLALKGMGKAVARSKSLKAKVVLLNYKNDRETPGYNSTDYVSTIVDTLNYYTNVATQPLAPSSRSNGTSARSSPQPITHPLARDAHRQSRREGKRYPANRFITHLVHLEGGDVPVDEAKLHEMGIKSIKVPLLLSIGSRELGEGSLRAGPGGGQRRFDVASVEWAMERVWEAAGR